VSDDILCIILTNETAFMAPDLSANNIKVEGEGIQALSLRDGIRGSINVFRSNRMKKYQR